MLAVVYSFALHLNKDVTDQPGVEAHVSGSLTCTKLAAPAPAHAAMPPDREAQQWHPLYAAGLVVLEAAIIESQTQLR